MYSDRGNILFLILLGIVLLGALVMAVKSQRENVPVAITKEKANAYAAQLYQNVNLIENTMMRAMTVDNIPDYGFDLSGTDSHPAANATCASQACKIYASQGGGVPDLGTPAWASTNNNANNRRAYFRSSKVKGIGTDNEDLIVLYMYLQRDVCEALNRLAGNTDIDLDANLGLGTAVNYTGTLTSFPTGAAFLNGGNAPLADKRSACFNWSASGNYYFFHVLIPR